MTRKQRSEKIFFFGAFLASTFFVGVSFFYTQEVTYVVSHLPQSTSTALIAKSTSTQDSVEKIKEIEFASHIETPEQVKGIYMTQCVVGTPSFRTRLVDLVEETELNSIVIDIKDYSGKIGFNTDNPKLEEYVSDQCGAWNIEEFIKTLHEKNIYVIGRITVFQDPFYSQKHPELAVKFAEPKGEIWKDYKGLSFIDVGAKPYWDYIVELSLEAHRFGFDELNYDYIRYPSDGPVGNIHFDWAGDKEKAEALEEFFVYLHKEMKDENIYPQGVKPPVLSADLFGMVTTNTNDLNIGQVLERALPYFDHICPMVYPSHYPRDFNGWSNPNGVPYELIRFVLNTAVERTVADTTSVKTIGGEMIYETIVIPPTASSTATTTKKVETGVYIKEEYDKNKIRPWLQDFNLGAPAYGAAEVRAQIQATYDAGLSSWMLWDAANTYTKGALESASSTSSE